MMTTTDPQRLSYERGGLSRASRPLMRFGSGGEPGRRFTNGGCHAAYRRFWRRSGGWCWAVACYTTGAVLDTGWARTKEQAQHDASRARREALR